MISFPNAKINLGLNILSKREDGYHNIESCFVPVKWMDLLEIIPSHSTVFTASGVSIPGNPGDNLCLKAYQLLKDQYDLPPVHIHLHKIIPIGAGLGGGSSDAAFTLSNLNTQFSLNIHEKELLDYARKLGSDCAFFLRNTPVIASEKGDVFKDIALNLMEKKVVIVYPGTHISSKEAYTGVIPKIPSQSIRDVLNMPIENWKDHLENDFEHSIFSKYPSIKAIKEKLYDLGALYASLSGSGSAVYGLFDKSVKTSTDFPDEYQIWVGELN